MIVGSLVDSSLVLTGIKKVYVNLSDEVVLVETSLPSSDVKQRLEDMGRLVVFRGYGGTGLLLHATPFCPLMFVVLL